MAPLRFLLDRLFLIFTIGSNFPDESYRFIKLSTNVEGIDLRDELKVIRRDTP